MTVRDEYGELARLAEKTRLFLFNLTGAVSFFVFGGFFAGYWLLVASLPSDIPYVWVLGLIGAIVLSILLAYLISSLPRPRAKVSVFRRLKYGRLRWLIAFVLPFIIAYNVAPVVLGLEPKLFEELTSVLWFPALGAALLLVHVLVVMPLEKRASGFMRSKPFLLAGSISLLTSPLVFAVALLDDADRAWMIALGLMVISYSISGLHALYSALKVFEE